MDTDERLKFDHNVRITQWASRFLDCRGEKLTSWVSSFHQDRLSCELVHEDVQNDQRGSYNWCCQVVFSNGENWIVRFPRGGRVQLPDEKVANEVAVMLLVRQRTEIPVPIVKAWGLSRDNLLDLGPFIMTSFVEGISLGKILQDPCKDTRILSHVDDRILGRIYRQVTRFQLQLAALDFPRIGCPSQILGIDDAFAAAVDQRPMTWKAHGILQDGGIDVLCSPSTTFASTTEYFSYVAQGDLTHLQEQLNSIDDEEDARQKYCYWTVFYQLASRMALPKYNYGPFKLMCDDFGPGNMIVNNSEDLEIVAVIDWEWSYAGPYQLFWTPPRWLLLLTPNSWSVYDERLKRYEHCLLLYVNALEEEEKVYLLKDATQEKPSTLVKQAWADGRTWYHHIILGAFNGPTHVPFQELRASVDDFDELVSAISSSEIEQFVERKRKHLQSYNSELMEKQGLR